jgi:hypothetical protein
LKNPIHISSNDFPKRGSLNLECNPKVHVLMPFSPAWNYWDVTELLRRWDVMGGL